MSEESASFEKSVALERRAYWQNVYEAALAANDDDTAAQALRFVKEYEAYIAALDQQERSDDTKLD